MASYETRAYPGGAPETTLSAPISAGATSFTVATGTGAGYPDGSAGPFFVIVDYDNSLAEKIRVTSRTGDVFTVPGTDGRGSDGTTAVSHGVQAKVRAVWTATDAQEANRAAVNTVGKVTSKGDLLAGTGANTLARRPVGTDGQVLTADSTDATGVSYKNQAVGVAGITATGTPSATTYLRGDATWTAPTIRVPHTFAVSGSLAVASGALNYIPPFYVPVPAGQTATIAAVRASVRSGSVQVAVNKNGTAVTNLGTISVTTTATTTTATGGNTCANGDAIAIVLSSPASADGLTVTVWVDYQL